MFFIETMCLRRTLVATLLALSVAGAAFAEDGAKRAPSGFLGMRGKKQGGVGELVYEDMNKINTGMGFHEMGSDKDQNADVIEYDPDFYEKRAPSMGFQGVRGKKDDFNVYEEEQKRAPSMGFQGVRGKKDNDFNVYEEEQKRAPGSGFQGMRGKKDHDWNQDGDLYDKRSPGMGFQGMRGKKDGQDDGIKRAPSMGFQGVRGKKDPEFQSEVPSEYFTDDRHSAWPGSHFEGVGDSSEYLANIDDIWGEGFDKRAPSGFLGMRGKKQPQSGFLGMRGKKVPSGFMGMRGKKVPSGFMGMRGKKDGVIDLETLLESLEAAPPEMTLRQKRYKSPSNIKKAPSGFLGMRGKKWVNLDLESQREQVGEAL